jgi:hypothetical protein
MKIRVMFDYETNESLLHETEEWEKFPMDKFETVVTNRPAPEIKVEKSSSEFKAIIPEGGFKVTEKPTIEPYVAWNQTPEKNPCEDIPEQLGWTQREWTEFYKFLLLKYITKVGQDEGFTFINGERPKYFTEYEWETLKHLDEYSYDYTKQITREVGT